MNTELLLARRELSLAKRVQSLRAENQIFFYEPHPKQVQFHAAAGFHYRYARTGNRFGKSEMGATEDVAYALGYRPWFPEGDSRRTLGIPNRPTKGLIVTTDWDKSTEVFTSQESGPNVGKLFKYIPAKDMLGSTKNHSGAIDMIRVQHYDQITGKPDGISVMHLDTVKSYKQNQLGQESSWWDWIHYDEPVPEAMYKANIRGLMDHDGYVWFTCTPLSEPWIDAKFIPDMQEQTLEDLGVQTNGDFWMMTGKTDDNPHNTSAAIERVMSQYSEEERETRRSGIPKAYFGLVYGSEFQWNVHVRREPPIGWVDWYKPPADHTIRFAIDYHPRKPHHVLFIATSPLEYHYAFAEVFISCLMEDLVADIRMVLGLRDPTVPGLIDPLSETPNQVTDITAMDRVLQLGLPVIPATKDPHNGILAVKSLLKQRDRCGNPTFLVNGANRRFLYEISRGYMWDADTNKPKKIDDDAMENFYRLALQGLQYIEPSTSADYTPIAQRETFANVIDFSENLSAQPFEDRPQRSVAFASRYRR